MYTYIYKTKILVKNMVSCVGVLFSLRQKTVDYIILKTNAKIIGLGNG